MYGEITHYLPNHHAGGRSVGLPSDDTQLCAWAIEQVLRDGSFDPSAYLTMLAGRQVYGMGSTVRAALRAWGQNRDWLAATQHSAGNGALMRCPAGFAGRLAGNGEGLGLNAAVIAATTHNDPAAISSAVVFTQMLAELLVMGAPPPTGGWVERYVDLAAPLEGNTQYKGRGAPLAKDHDGPLWQFVQQQVGHALTTNRGVREACDGWHSGAYLLETIPSVLFILARHAGNPAQAIIRAVNDTRDNDTIGAVVGAAVGALHGEVALPEPWRSDLLGRTRDADDGALFILLDDLQRGRPKGSQ